MTRDAMKRRKETAGVIRKIEAYTMATRKPCKTDLKAARGQIRTLWTT